MAHNITFSEDGGQRFDKVVDHEDPNQVDGAAAGPEESPTYYTDNEIRVHLDRDDTQNENLEIDNKVENLTLSSDELEASAEPAPFGENFAVNQEAQDAPSKNLYASSSGSLFDYSKSELIKDEESFRTFVDEQCQSDPGKQKRVEQGLIYNTKEICPSNNGSLGLEEYRKGIEWKLVKYLGSGTFGEVFECKSLLTGKFHAVKMVDQSKEDRKVDVRLDEIILWQRLGRHPNVCELYAVTYEEDALWFHMELARFAEDPAQNLPQYVSTLSLDPSAQIPLVGLLKAGRGLLEGIDHMHKQSITHRDLNGKNIMVTTGLHLKIIDFSFIRAVTEDNHYDKDLKGGLASFFQLVTRKKKDPDNWTGDAVKDCIKDRKDVDMLLPLCEALISHLKYAPGSAEKVAGWMAWEINRRLANILIENPEEAKSLTG